jgi:site-specific recombinase XerC
LLQRTLSGMSIRHRLAALSSLFEYRCEKNAVTHNPVKGVKRPLVKTCEGKTPALGDHQARALLDAPDGASIKGNWATPTSRRPASTTAARPGRRTWPPW